MKNSSIKKRVTLYYALVLISITLIISLLLSFSIERQINVITRDTLIKAVQNSFEDIDYQNQIIEIDNDFDSYVKGVTLLVYSESGNLIKGSVPSDFPSYTPLSVGDYQEIETDEHIWLFYDLTLGAYTMMFSHVATVISATVGIIRFDIKKKK